jgi:hypothetical protein
MTYYHRDENGILKSKLENKGAQKVIDECHGHFRIYQIDGDPEKLAFEFDTASKFCFSGITVFFWEGDILVPE